MNKVKYYVVGISILLILVASGAFFSSRLSKPPAPQPQIHKIKIGYMPFTTNWPVFLAVKEGLFKKEGLEVELIKFNSGVEGANALITGDIASFSINTFTDLFNIEIRSPGGFKIYTLEKSTAENNSEALIVKTDSNIESVTDLKGKKIGINPGTFIEAMMKQAYKGKLDFNNDVTLIKLAPNLQLGALESGQIDALLALEPTISIATNRGTARILDNHPWRRVSEPFPIGGVTFSTKVDSSKPELIKKIANSFKQAILLGREDQSKIQGAVRDYVDLEESVIVKLKYNEDVFGEEITPDMLNATAKLYYNLGITSKQANTQNILYVLQK